MAVLTYKVKQGHRGHGAGRTTQEARLYYMYYYYVLSVYNIYKSYTMIKPQTPIRTPTRADIPF